MTDRLITRGWWLTTMLMIVVTAASTMFVAYRGVFSTFSGAFVDGAIDLLACLPLGAACWMLCRYRGDLVGE